MTLILDLYCGAGGSAKGYHDAGFGVIGVDAKDQPNYPYSFYQGDALALLPRLLTQFDVAAIHASPPCQRHSRIGKQSRAVRPDAHDHVDLVTETRAALIATGLPYVIENVVGAPLRRPLQLCGSSFGLDIRRHRLFECNFPVPALPCDHAWQTPRFPVPDKRRKNRLAPVVPIYGHMNYAGEAELRQRAMQIDWMTTYELTQAIPPAYTEYIGRHLKEHIG